ncbi:MAG TPA: polyhydroxybutyrate depolymerase, partial [Planctomycetota bacterium]|nr:polyhydroxybutyrate depolymerase [Planctomycetota bacterium]
DQHVRYDGGRPARSVGGAGRRVDASVAAAADYYVHRNGLAAVTHTDEQDGVKVETWDRAAGGGPVPATVVVVTLAGGGHAWPGGNSSGQPDADPPFAWDATTAIWKFFAGQRRPLH